MADLQVYTTVTAEVDVVRFRTKKRAADKPTQPNACGLSKPVGVFMCVSGWWWQVGGHPVESRGLGDRTASLVNGIVLIGF